MCNTPADRSEKNPVVPIGFVVDVYAGRAPRHPGTRSRLDFAGVRPRPRRPRPRITTTMTNTKTLDAQEVSRASGQGCGP